VQCFYDGLTEPHRQMVDASIMWRHIYAEK